MNIQIEDSAYLICDRTKRWSGSAGDLHIRRMTKKKPDLSAGEVAVKVTIALPSSLFDEPQLQARFEVPADAVTPPTVAGGQIENIEALILRETGLTVRLEPVDDGGEE